MNVYVSHMNTTTPLKSFAATRTRRTTPTRLSKSMTSTGTKTFLPLFAGVRAGQSSEGLLLNAFEFLIIDFKSLQTFKESVQFFTRLRLDTMEVTTLQHPCWHGEWISMKPLKRATTTNKEYMQNTGLNRVFRTKMPTATVRSLSMSLEPSDNLGSWWRWDTEPRKKAQSSVTAPLLSAELPSCCVYTRPFPRD